MYSLSKHTQSRSIPIDLTSSDSSPASSNSEFIRHPTPDHDRSLRPFFAEPGLSTQPGPKESWRTTFVNPQTDPPSPVKRMAPGSLRVHGAASPHEEFHHRQFIRPGRTPHHHNAQSSNDGYYNASYQAPPPVRTSHQPPHPQRATGDSAGRALPPWSKAAQSSSAMNPPAFPPPPLYSAARTNSQFLHSSPTAPHLLALQPSSRPHSPSSTVLPGYSSQCSASAVEIGSPHRHLSVDSSPLQSDLNQYIEPSVPQNPSLIAHTPRSTPSSLRIPVSNANSSPTNEGSTWYSSENEPSVRSSSSRSSHSPGGNPATPSVDPHLQPEPFVFPGSRSVARPSKLSLKVKSQTKPHSELPHSQPLPTSPIIRLTNSASSSNGSTSHENVLPRPQDTSAHRDTPSVFSNDSTDLSQRHSVSLPSPSENSSHGFVLPGGRSVGRPKVVPLNAHQSSNGKHEGKRSKLIGMLLRKKKNGKAQNSVAGLRPVSEVVSEQADVWLENDPANDPDSYPLRQMTDQESREQPNLVKSRIGEYPLDPYHSVLLDNDRHTGELLARLNPTGSPSFHNYGNNPPSSVLDLGCGQGHWVVDAAIAWKGYGTKVTGYDMVDISKGLKPWAVDQGVVGNIGFVRGNFLKQRLPFGNDSFDLVRMSCLALCITSDSWVFVLQEVSRVLMVGGRLELIDDLIFFPYGKASTSSYAPGSASNSRARQSIAPRLNVTIPSATFTTFSIYDSQVNNPGLGQGEGEEEAEGLYGVTEEDVDENTATLDESRNVGPIPDPPRNSLAPPRRSRTSRHSEAHSRSWTRGCATSGDLEALFDDMLEQKFGINKNPSEFVLGLMKAVFGLAQEIKTMHLTLAPLEIGIDGRRQRSTDSTETFMPGGGSRFGRASRRESTCLLRAPGLVLWPSTFIPMDQSELEIHASKHLRMLLSCKSHLLEHAIETTDHDEFDNNSLSEALWDYEGFLRRRFDPPPLSRSSGDDQGSDTLRNNRGSIAESFSSNRFEAGWVTEPESRQTFVWKRSLSQDPSATPGPGASAHWENTPTPPTFPLEASASASGGTDPSSPATPAPMYSRDELTHVRTFRIYEAIKLDESIFGSNLEPQF